MPVAEGVHLIRALTQMPDSRLAAKAQGWSRPISREEIAFLDFHDNFVRANSKPGRNPRPLPRPWDKPAKTYGGVKNRRRFTPDQMHVAFDARRRIREA